MLAIGKPWPSNWETFYQLATEEGWRIPQIERQLWRGPWAEYAHCLRGAGFFAGLVTAVPHQTSGWIGNLIVAPSLRGRGLGGRLFKHALADLLQRGLNTIWLTASEQGRPLYEKAGFIAVGQVERWVRPAGAILDRRVAPSPGDAQQLRHHDRLAWNEERATFLDHLLVNNQVFGCHDSVALLQKGVDMQILGPWYSGDLCLRSNHMLLQQVLAAADPDVELVTDILTPSPIHQILSVSGFHSFGRSQLMAKGPARSGADGMVLALASLGSVG